MKHMNIIGPNIRAWRRRRKLTQHQLAAKLRHAGHRVTRDMLANWETQQSAVSDWFVLGLASTLDIPIRKLFRPRTDQRG